MATSTILPGLLGVVSTDLVSPSELGVLPAVAYSSQCRSFLGCIDDALFGRLVQLLLNWLKLDHTLWACISSSVSPSTCSFLRRARLGSRCPTTKTKVELSGKEIIASNKALSLNVSGVRQKVPQDGLGVGWATHKTTSDKSPGGWAQPVGMRRVVHTTRAKRIPWIEGLLQAQATLPAWCGISLVGQPQATWSEPSLSLTR